MKLEPRTPFLQTESAKPTDGTLRDRFTAPTYTTIGRHLLPQFPEYEFDSDGNAYRVLSTAKSGPMPKLGKVEPSRNGQLSLRGKDGKRVSISPARLRELANKPDDLASARKFVLDDFPREFFDMTGSAFGIRDGRPRKYHPLNTRGKTVRRFRLFYKPTGCFVCVTDAALRRMRDGRASARAAEIPDGCRWLGSEFPDFCADTYTGQPYRISSMRYTVYEPLPVPMHKCGSYPVPNYAGKRIYLTTKQILDMVTPESRVPNHDS